MARSRFASARPRNDGTRRAVIGELARAVTRRGRYDTSGHELTSVHRHPPSAVALAFVTTQALASPHDATELAGKAFPSLDHSEHY